MTWADFYLVCFALGFAFSLLSFLLGGVHWHLPFHAHLQAAHGVHSGLVNLLFIASAHPATSTQSGGLGNTHQFHTQVALSGTRLLESFL